jgi:pimeloyl-ACP methyl ester carboxylesterase
MKRFWWSMLLFGLLLIMLAVWQVLTVAQGLRVVNLDSEGTPVTAYMPKDVQALERPVVLIGHGFAGSGTVMSGFALTLAHAGYNVLTWDFAGHGANPAPMGAFGQRDALVNDVERALKSARMEGLVNGGHVAILGHSMGSGVALAYGQLHPETKATIAISPVMRQVSTSLPQNLLLMAGSQEPGFLETARQLLAQAGGESGNPAQGTARRLVTIPGANHLTILFSVQAHQSVLDWIDCIYGVQPGAEPYTDRRLAWFGLGVVGTLLASFALAWRVRPGEMASPPVRKGWHKLAAMFIGALAATIILWLLARAGLEITSLFGLLVGGYLMVWFALAGLTGMVVLRLWPKNISIQATMAGFLTFILLWIGIGLLSHLVWLPWLMILKRMVLWPLAVVLLLPWFLLLSELVRGKGWLRQIVVWLVHSLLLLGGLFLAMQVTPGIGFLILIMPVFPIFFGIHNIAAGPYQGGWSFALSGSLFTAWLLLVVFPLG